jgi:hypothetical protein
MVRFVTVSVPVSECLCPLGMVRVVAVYGIPWDVAHDRLSLCKGCGYKWFPPSLPFPSLPFLRTGI